MKRTTSSILILAAVAGVAVTVVLVALSLGSGRRRTVRADAETRIEGEAPDAGPERGIDGFHPVEPLRGGRIDRGVRPPGAFPPDASREPFDGPSTPAEIATDSEEVLRLLAAIPAEDDAQKRFELYRELQKLIRGLGHHLPQAHRQRLLEMLLEVDPKYRRLVGETLGYLRGDAGTAGQLLAMLEGRPENRYTRLAILDALGKMGVQEIVPKLLIAVRGDHEDEEAIVAAIGRIGGEAASDGLLGLLEGPLASRTRRAVERALGDGRNPAVLGRLEEALATVEDSQTRLSYVRILGESRDPVYAESLRALLAEERDPQVRKEAIRALGRFGDPASGELLLDLVQNGSQQERMDATNAIYSIKNSATVNKLAEGWDRLGPDAQRAVMMAGRRITQPSEQLIEIAKKNLRDSSLRMRTYSAQLLGRRGRDDAVDPLVDFLRGAGHSSEQSAALRALLQIRTKKAAEEGLASLYVISSEQRRIQYEKEFERILAREAARPR